MENNLNNINDKSFEEALIELESIVDKLSKGKDSLEESIELYERGNALKEHCSKKLAEAKLKIEKIIEKEDGSITSIIE